MSLTTSTYRSPWLLALLVAFGVVVAVNVLFAVLATRSDVGYIEDHTWERDQHFQLVLDAEQRFRESGLKALLSASTKERVTTLTLEFSQQENTTPFGWEINVIARRGDARAKDLTLVFSEVASGKYTAHTEAMLSGLWLFEVNLYRSGVDMRFLQRQFI